VFIVSFITLKGNLMLVNGTYYTISSVSKANDPEAAIEA
jgi:hypothetical protein